MSERRNFYSKCFSSKAFELFSKLAEKYKDAYYGNNELKIGRYKVDFAKDNKIIEFYGDYWHCNLENPKLSKWFFSLDNIWRDNITIRDIRNKDIERIKFIESNGYEVLIIWEYDYNNNKLNIVEKCQKFLENL